MATLNPTGPPPAAQPPTPAPGPPQTGVLSNTPQGPPTGNPGPAQGRPLWWQRVVRWNWSERAQWLAVITLITGIIYGAVSWVSSDQQAVIAKWEAEKDFFLYCQSVKDSSAKLSVECSPIVDRGLPPPPFHSPNFFYALSSLVQRRLSGIWVGNQTSADSHRAKSESTPITSSSSSALFLSSKSSLIPALNPSYTESHPKPTGISLTTNPKRVGSVEYIGLVPTLFRLCVPFVILQSYIDLGRTTMILQNKTISVLSATLWLRVRGAHGIRMWVRSLIGRLRPIFQPREVVIDDGVLAGPTPKTTPEEEALEMAPNMQPTQWRFSTLQVVQATKTLMQISRVLGEIIIIIFCAVTLVACTTLPLYPLLSSLYGLTRPTHFFSTDMLYALLHLDFSISQVGMFIPRLESFLVSVSMAAEREGVRVSGKTVPPSSRLSLSSSEMDRQERLLDPGVVLFAYGFSAAVLPISLPTFCQLLGVGHGFSVGLAAYATGTVLIGVIMKNTCILMKLYRMKQ